MAVEAVVSWTFCPEFFEKSDGLAARFKEAKRLGFKSKMESLSRAGANLRDVVDTVP
jgi:hypothetical protein